MKKTIVLLTIVLAILAAPVFAETGFSGSVEFKYATDFDAFKTDTGNDTKISLDGKVGEFSKISVGIEADEDSNASATLMTLTQDVTGALGVEGPVSFSYKMGKQTYSPADYSKVGGYEDAGADAKIGQAWTVDTATLEFSTDAMLGTVLTFGIMDMINLDVAVYPGSYFEKAAGDAYFTTDTYTEIGVNAYGTFGPVKASAYFVGSPYTNLKEDLTDPDSDDIDTNGTMIGANAGIVIDALSVGILWETDLENEYVDWTTLSAAKTEVNTELGIAAKYVLGSVTPGVAFKTSIKDGYDFAADSGMGLNVKWNAFEAFNVTAAVKNSFDFSDFANTVAYEAGIDYTLDGVKYSVGYTDGSEFAAYDAEMNDNGNMYVKVKASF